MGRRAFTGMVGDALRYAGAMSYRFGLGPRPSDVPDGGLVEVVEGPARRPPGRALDLGCGTGRNAVYLARHGWDVTGVELAVNELTVARRGAADAGVQPRLIHGDVTELAGLGIGQGFTVLMDGGCYHMVPKGRRDAYVASVSQVAAPGALLVLVGFTRVFGSGMGEEQVRARFRGWDLVRAERIPGEEMQSYVTKPALIKQGLRNGWFAPARYLLEWR